MNFSSDPIHTLENLIAKNRTRSISIYLVVVLVLIGILVCLPHIKVDISSQSRGIIRSKADNVLVSPVVSGKITVVNLKDNQFVTKGDTLVVINRGNLKIQIALNDSLLVYRYKELEDYKFLLKNQPSYIKEPIILKAYQSYKAQLQGLQNRLSQAQQNYNRYNELYKKDVIARADYETHLYNLRFANANIKELQEQQISTWQNNIQQTEETIKNLESRQSQLQTEGDNYVLTAPVSGTLENVLGLQPNAFINAAQAIATISPIGNLIIENTVTPNDIGLLKVGQKVHFQIDAFNYNQWGMLNGEVVDIDKNITIQENNTFFKVRCKLYSSQLKLKNGYATNVSKGMTLTTRYFITRRSLYELLFDKVDDWLNPKIVN